MLEKLRRQLSRIIAPAQKPGGTRQVRMYQNARVTRLTTGWNAPNGSADAELSSSLRILRGRSRALIRDAGFAKRARQVVVNNVIGSGVGFQAAITNNRGRLVDEVNGTIESAWAEWCRAENCHTGGKLHFHDLQRAAMAQIFEAGEVIIRKHRGAFGKSNVPIALELIEAERIADDYNVPISNGVNEIRMGVEVDAFYRPVAYWLRDRHPGDIRPSGLTPTDKLVRVPADQIIHLYVCERWPQTRGEPWLHAAARRLNDMDGLSEAEITAARAAACYAAFVESDIDNGPPPGETAESEVTTQTDRTTTIEPGIIEYLRPGEKLASYAPTRPNAALDPFMRMMLREVAAATGVSYEALSRDYSQSNYSSSRLSLLDDRDTWRTLQLWFIRSFLDLFYREWLGVAVLKGAVKIDLASYVNAPAQYEAVRWKPRGWGWVDPTKEVAAYKEAVRAGFTTVGDVIAATNNGGDLEDTLKARRNELDLMKDLELEFDTMVPNPDTLAGKAPAPPQSDPAASEGDVQAAAAKALDAVSTGIHEDIAQVRAAVSAKPAPINITLEMPAPAPAEKEPIKPRLKEVIAERRADGRMVQQYIYEDVDD